jgi:hypothetical protein
MLGTRKSARGVQSPGGSGRGGRKNQREIRMVVLKENRLEEHIW